MNLEILTKSDLQSFKQELITEIKNILGQSNTKEQKWLKGIDVRKLLNISPGTLQNLRINGTLNPSKIGGTLFYKRSDIQKLLEVGNG
jgi:hypothetical protein